MSVKIRNDYLYVSTNKRTLKFDEFVEEKDGGYVWVTVCKKCMQKYADEFKYLSDKDLACIDDYGSGCCSVFGCDTPDCHDLEDDDGTWDSVYVDFIVDKKKFRGEE